MLEDCCSNLDYEISQSHLLSSEASAEATATPSCLHGWFTWKQHGWPWAQGRVARGCHVTVTLATAAALKSESSGEPMQLLGLKCETSLWGQEESQEGPPKGT